MSSSITTHITRLRRQIDDLRHRYHVLNDPEVTDAMYQGLMHELRQLELAHPELITPDSPTQRVAGTPLDKFVKIKHHVTQWSFNDAFDEKDLAEWVARVQKFLAKKLGAVPDDLSYVCELKIDGLHLVLTYTDGLLQTGATRGDGVYGEDVTTNIKTIHTIPLRLREPVDMVVEGEVWMSTTQFDRLNRSREQSGEALFANPRNATAGTVRQLDPQVVADRKLSFTAYDISSGDIPETQSKELDRLAKLGFLTGEEYRVARTLDEMLDYWKQWQDKRGKTLFWADGVVVKVNQKKYQDMLGFTGKAPRWAIALKFPAEQGTTKIIDVYIQVGRTGALTPVAHMEPVSLAGTTVTHATLHNFDEIARLGVRIGDTVVVEKAGDIIPKVVRVLDKLRTGKEKKINIPDVCPVCGARVARREIVDKKQGVSAGLFCTNATCFAKERERVIHFVSKKAFNIEGLGKKIVEQLLDQGLIARPSDIFLLTHDELASMERFGDKSATNLIASINGAKKVSFERFIIGLGVRHVGEETAIRLAHTFDTIDDLLHASYETLESIADVGPRVAESIMDFITNKRELEHIRELFDRGVKIVYPSKGATDTLPLTGKTFVLTGSLTSLSRDEAGAEIRKRGGHISSAVSVRTSFVIAGTDPGSKLAKAQKLGVVILDEKNFIALLDMQ